MKKLFVCFVIFVITGIVSAFLGAPGEMTFVVGGVCALLYLLCSRKKYKKLSKEDINRVSASDIQSTNSYCTLNNLRFYGWKGDDYDYSIISLKNGHDYNLYRLRNTSSNSRYFIYVYDIGGKKSPSKRYYATSRDAVDAIETMDCRFCKWFKNKNKRNATYLEFSDWISNHQKG